MRRPSRETEPQRVCRIEANEAAVFVPQWEEVCTAGANDIVIIRAALRACVCVDVARADGEERVALRSTSRRRSTARAGVLSVCCAPRAVNQYSETSTADGDC